GPAGGPLEEPTTVARLGLRRFLRQLHRIHARLLDGPVMAFLLIARLLLLALTFRRIHVDVLGRPAEASRAGDEHGHQDNHGLTHRCAPPSGFPLPRRAYIPEPGISLESVGPGPRAALTPSSRPRDKRPRVTLLDVLARHLASRRDQTFIL